jgi:Tol biopolymer transport system component
VNPLVTNLEDIQTLIFQLQSNVARVNAISEVGEGLWLPRWANDRSKLVLTSIGGRIVTSTVDGTARYDLGPGDSPAWSPDNKRLAYAGTSAGDEFISRDIHVVDWQGRGPRLRLTDAGEEEFYTSPSWSPDSTRIAFIEIDSGQLFVGIVPQD